MRLFLNELSLTPIASNKQDAIDRMTFFSRAVGRARDFGFRQIQSDEFTNQMVLAMDYTVYDWLIDSTVSKEQRDFLFGVIIPPYIHETDEAIMEEFVEKEFTFKDDERKFPKSSCIGLASAYLYNFPSISIKSHLIWEQTSLTISIRKNERLDNKVVYNISSTESFNDARVIAFIERISVLSLDETPITPENKKVTLFGDHHGKKELKKLSDKLIYNPYVIEIRSTDYGGSKFIRKIKSDGVIEVVLTDTDSRYALWVQTTGKNLKETRAISEKIKEEFS